MAIPGISTTQDIGLYVDEDGTPQVFETPGGLGAEASVELTYLMPWARDIRYGVFRELIGGFTQWNGLGVPAMGHAYWDSPNFYCQSIGRITPLGINKEGMRLHDLESPGDYQWRLSNWPKYCLVPCVYKPPALAYNLAQADQVRQIDPADPLVGCIQRTEANSSFIVVDNAKMEILKYGPAPDYTPTQQAPRKVLTSTDGIPANTISFTLEYPRVPRHPYLFLLPYLGRVNRYPMWGLDPGHILFSTVTIEHRQTALGPELACTLGYIGNKDVGWNEALDDDGGVKPKVFVNNEGTTFKYPFRDADLMMALR